MISARFDLMRTPRAITMWDFSWLERRWMGGGFEDWNRNLSELKERGYDSVRIDAYPHLISSGSDRSWRLLPVWNQQDWGAPGPISVQPLPHLIDFIRLCEREEIGVVLSSWFREDETDVRQCLSTPRAMANAWIRTLTLIEQAGLLDQILYVDLCNEFPIPAWAPAYQHNVKSEADRADWRTPDACNFMRCSIEIVRERFPALLLCYSLAQHHEDSDGVDLSFMDLVEPHIWMSSANKREFYRRVGYGFERFSPDGYLNMARHGEAMYRADEAYWLSQQRKLIDCWAKRSVDLGRPLATTEGWAVVDYKDWPMLDWGWVKDLTAEGVKYASATGRWLALCTSNFCAPQFVGMWSDVEYHRNLTDIIRSGDSPVPGRVNRPPADEVILAERVVS